MNRGEIWLYLFKPPDKRRPVLVLSRPDVIPLLSTVMVAPITSTIRGAPSEVVVGVEEGLKTEERARSRPSRGRPPGIASRLCPPQTDPSRARKIYVLVIVP